METPAPPVVSDPAPSAENENRLTISVRKTWRGARVLSSSVTPNGIMRARVKTKMKPGSTAVVSVSYSDGDEENREIVKKNGVVEFTAYVERYNYIFLLDDAKENLVRWTTR
jgi:hypothetical protein